jgi:hypothetical protein
MTLSGGWSVKFRADARQIDEHIDAMGAQRVRRSDTGLLQQLRRSDRSG